MKKWQIGILGIVIGQAISSYKKDNALREKVSKEEGFLAKAKVIGESRLQDNKELFEEIKNTDWDKTIESVEKNISYDKEKIKKRGEEQSEKDWENTGHETVRSIIENIPDKKKLADGLEKYKQRIVQWWDSL